MHTEPQILRFCQAHDWGFNASLVDGRIVGLVDAYVKDGELHEAPASIPATMKAAREFGQY